jgi:hypothetical protein
MRINGGNIMNTIAIKSSKDKIIVTFDKTESNVDILLKFLDRLEIEQKAKKIDFSKDILKIAQEIKGKWWQANKQRFLKQP